MILYSHYQDAHCADAKYQEILLSLYYILFSLTTKQFLMHPLSTHACLANVSSLKITTTPVLKMNIFFSTDLASISDETDIKNSKVGLRCKINKAFMDFFLHNG